MKRKPIFVPGMEILKWHFLAFVIVTSFHWITVLATFEYPGNREVPFEMFRGFIVERIGYTLAWAVLLLAHFGIQELRKFLLYRAYDEQIDPFLRTDQLHSKRLKNSPQAEDDQVPLVEDTQKIKYL